MRVVQYCCTLTLGLDRRALERSIQRLSSSDHVQFFRLFNGFRTAVHRRRHQAARESGLLAVDLVSGGGRHGQRAAPPPRKKAGYEASPIHLNGRIL